MTLDIPVPGEGTNSQGDSTMALGDDLHAQNMSQLGQIGVLAQANLVTVSKAQDYDYLQAKNLVSLSEAVGVREVAARVTPAGPVPATAVS